jgi:hypothetical protein
MIYFHFQIYDCARGLDLTFLKVKLIRIWSNRLWNQMIRNPIKINLKIQLNWVSEIAWLYVPTIQHTNSTVLRIVLQKHIKKLTYKLFWPDLIFFKDKLVQSDPPKSDLTLICSIAISADVFRFNGKFLLLKKHSNNSTETALLIWCQLFPESTLD